MATPAPNESPRRPSRWWLIPLALVVVAGGFVLVRRLLAPKLDLVQWVITETEGEVVPARVEGHINGTLILYDVTLNVAEGRTEPLPVAKIAKATGELDWSDFRKTHKAWPTRVAIEGFSLELALDENNDLVFPDFDYDEDDEPESPKPSVARAEKPEWPRLKGEPHVVDINLSGGTVHYEIPELTLSGKPPIELTMVEAHGTYTEKRTLVVDMFSGVFLGAVLSADATFTYRRDRPYEVHAQLGPVDLPQALQALLADPPSQALAGKATIDGTITGKRGGYELVGALKADELEFSDLPLTGAALRFRYAGGSVEVLQGQIAAFGGTIDVTGSAVLKGQDRPANASMVLQGLDFGAYLRDREIPSYGLTGAFSGTVDVARLTPTAWHAELDLSSHDGTILSPFTERSVELAEDPSLEPTDAELMPYTELHIAATASEKQALVDQVALVAPDLTLIAGGTAAIPGPVDIAGRIRARRDRAREIPEYGQYIWALPDDDAGFVAFDFTLGGTIEHPEFDPLIEKNARKGLEDRIRDLGNDVEEAFRDLF